jgi:hypothetical protein
MWLKQQATAVLSSIKSPPTDSDVQMFVNIAESEGLLFFSKTCVPAADGMTRWSDPFSRIVKQLVGFEGLFDFWVGLAEGLWKKKDKLIPSGGTPEEVSTYTKH